MNRFSDEDLYARDDAGQDADDARVENDDDALGLPRLGPRHAGARWRARAQQVRSQRARAQNRNWIVIAAFAVIFTGLGGRMAVLGAAGAPTRAAATVGSEESRPRADIVDRNGHVLAVDLETATLFVDPRAVIEPERAADALVGALDGVSRPAVLSALTSNRSYRRIKRHLSPVEQQAVLELGLPGLGFRPEYKRLYPRGAVTSHLVGYTDVDNQGRAGVEQGENQWLLDHAGDGARLRLSIDLAAQFAARDELAAAMARNKAKSGIAIVMDARNGEIVALVSMPDYDPNDAAAAPSKALFNNATYALHEMGSTFKTVTVAMGLSYGVVNMTETFDTWTPIKVDRFRIRDPHPQRGPQTLADIYRLSSNNGATQIALRVGATGQREFMKRLGLFDKLPLEIYERAEPNMTWMREHGGRTWPDSTVASLSYGYGLSVTPAHLITAVASIVNGERVWPTVLKRDEPLVSGQRILSPAARRDMLAMMREVVTNGTGKRADVEGYPVAGKTGTARKTVGRGYKAGKLYSSFVGAFPAKDPSYVVLVAFDEATGPKGAAAYGGTVAAPVVANIVRRIGPILAVEPEFGPDESGDVIAALLQSDGAARE